MLTPVTCKGHLDRLWGLSQAYTTSANTTALGLARATDLAFKVQLISITGRNLMNIKAYKIEIFAVAGAIAFTAFFFSSSPSFKINVAPKSIFQSGYIMPRINSILSFFSLEGREVSYQLINPFHSAQERTPVKKDLKTAPAKTPAKVSAADEAKKKAAAQAAASAKKNKIETKVVALADRFQGAADIAAVDTAVETLSQNTNAPVTAQNEVKAVAKKLPTSSLEDAAYWKAQLQAQPTPAQAYRFVEAYNSKKIDEASFYDVIQALSQSGNVAHQKLAIYIMYNQTSARAFAVVAKNSEHMNDEVKPIAEKYLASYSDASKIGVMSVVLTSSDRAIQTKALTVLVSGLTKIKSGVNPNQIDGRNDRGTFNSTSALAAYMSLVPTLQQLAVNQDAATSQSAMTILSQLQTVASNQ